MNRSDKAVEIFRNKFNCSQSVLSVFAGDFGISENDSLKISCAFGGGMGRQQHICGAVTGALMVLGLKYGKGINDPEEKKQVTYAKTRQFFEEFIKIHGSANCLDLLDGLNMMDPKDHEKITERKLFETKCEEYVASAVKITENIFDEQGMKAEELKRNVREKYGRIAEQSAPKQSCCSSSSCCGPQVDYTVFSENYETKTGYNPDADLNLGCGIPTDYAGIKAGDHVLDLGSGAGNDCFVARAIVGANGRVTGLDMTEAMIQKARTNCEKLRYNNVEFVLGDIEYMPFSDIKFDVVISNCVLNLVPDKTKAFKEIFRVLKPGGHFCVSDVVIKGILSDKMKNDAEMYAGCVSGASEMNEYLKIVEDSGFADIKVHKQKEIKLPEKLLAGYNDPDEIKAYQTGETGIFSITVSGYKIL